MRDFTPAETARRNYVFSTIRDVYELYGFRQIETPAMENLATLMGKYGEEGDKLLFKVLNSGNFLESVAEGGIDAANPARLAALICGKGLRYDLTVPFARFVVQHREELRMPFRRYQIQPVWRADRPQKGRYREFWQCDADVVGSDSLVNETELLQIADEVFSRFGMKVRIRLNNRKILAAVAAKAGAAGKIAAVTAAIDRLEKAGTVGVRESLAQAGIGEEAVAGIMPVISAGGTNEEKIMAMRRELAADEAGLKGLDEAEYVLGALARAGTANEVCLDLSLARGLDYYTGCIFEASPLGAGVGSVAGGGRYDNLTGIFGMPGLSGVGISFGADRICDVLDALGLFPAAAGTVQLLFVNFGEAGLPRCMELAGMARRAGIRTEVYPDSVRVKKQMSYAAAGGAAFVALVGEEELAAGSVTLKDMRTGGQARMTAEEMIEAVRRGLPAALGE